MIVIDRNGHLSKLLNLLRTSRVVALLGVRQGGKTTLARQVLGSWKGPTDYFDLERPEDLARLEEPMLTLEPLRGLVIIDEVQHRPNLFPVLRVLADKPRSARRKVTDSCLAPYDQGDGFVPGTVRSTQASTARIGSP